MLAPSPDEVHPVLKNNGRMSLISVEFLLESVRSPSRAWSVADACATTEVEYIVVVEGTVS